MNNIIEVTDVVVKIPVTKKYLKNNKLTKEDYKMLVENILDRYANDEYFDFTILEK